MRFVAQTLFYFRVKHERTGRLSFDCFQFFFLGRNPTGRIHVNFYDFPYESMSATLSLSPIFFFIDLFVANEPQLNGDKSRKTFASTPSLSLVPNRPCGQISTTYATTHVCFLKPRLQTKNSGNHCNHSSLFYVLLTLQLLNKCKYIC